MDGKLVRHWYGTDDLMGEDGLVRASHLSISLGQLIAEARGEGLDHYLEIIGKGSAPFQVIAHAIVQSARDAALKIFERLPAEDEQPMSIDASGQWLHGLDTDVGNVTDVRMSEHQRMESAESLAKKLGQALEHPAFLSNKGAVRGIVQESSLHALLGIVSDGSGFLHDNPEWRSADATQRQSAGIILESMTQVSAAIDICLHKKKWSDVIRANGGLR